MTAGAITGLSAACGDRVAAAWLARVAALIAAPAVICSCSVRPPGRSKIPYPAVHATASMATGTASGSRASGDRRAAANDPVSRPERDRMKDRIPRRKMGSAIQCHDAAAIAMAMAVCAALAARLTDLGPARPL